VRTKLRSCGARWAIFASWLWWGERFFIELTYYLLHPSRNSHFIILLLHTLASYLPFSENTKVFGKTPIRGRVNALKSWD
jgi:hypothetical protein